MTLEGSPFYNAMKRGRSDVEMKGAVIGQFQKARLVRKLVYGCLVWCQAPGNIIRDLMS